MTDRAWIATRKGLFELRHRDGGWRIDRHHFLGEPVRPAQIARGQGVYAASCAA